MVSKSCVFVGLILLYLHTPLTTGADQLRELASQGDKHLIPLIWYVDTGFTSLH